MERILIEKAPSPHKLEVLGVESWPLEKLACGRHVIEYAAAEEYCLVEGKAVLSHAGQTARHKEEAAAGDLLFIPRGLSVVWEVVSAVEYHRRPAGTK